METTIGERIKKARKVCGFTQAELAKTANISTVTLNRYETGHRSLDAELIVNLASILNCESYWLLTGQGEMIGDGTKTSNRPCLNDQNDPILTEIMQILINDLPDEKESFLKVLIGRKQMREGLSELGVVNC